jgi:hypothetical protein
MVNSTLDEAQRLVDQLTPHEQVRLLAYLTGRLAQVVMTMQPPPPRAPSETADPWETFFQLGEALAAADTSEGETLTAAVLAMRR